jgi:hypothetical protein
MGISLDGVPSRDPLAIRSHDDLRSVVPDAKSGTKKKIVNPTWLGL